MARRPQPRVDVLMHVMAAVEALDDRMSSTIDERDRRYQERYEASVKALDAAFLAADKAVQAALAAQEKGTQAAMVAAKEAVTKAELAGEKRFELLNELRIGVATKDEIQALEKLVNAVKEEVVGLRQRGAGVSASVAMMMGLGGLVVTIIGVAVAIVVASTR